VIPISAEGICSGGVHWHDDSSDCNEDHCSWCCNCEQCSGPNDVGCGNYLDSEPTHCADCGNPRCDDCLTSCTQCEYYCCREFTIFQGEDVCVSCAEGMADALGDHFAAGAEHDQWNEGQG